MNDVVVWAFSSKIRHLLVAKVDTMSQTKWQSIGHIQRYTLVRGEYLFSRGLKKKLHQHIAYFCRDLVLLGPPSVQNEKYLALPMYALKVSCPHAASRWGENGLTMTNAVKALKPFQQLLTFLHFDIERFERKRFLGDIIMNIYFSNLSPGQLTTILRKPQKIKGCYNPAAPEWSRTQTCLQASQSKTQKTFYAWEASKFL